MSRRTQKYLMLLLTLTVFTVEASGLVMITRSITPGIYAAAVSVPPVDPILQPALHAQQERAAEIDARFKQAIVMLHAKQYENAVIALHRVLELAPDMPEAHVNMGFAMIGMKRYAAARDFFDAAIDLRPTQVNAYYGLAEALEGMNNLEGAMGAMKSYIHLTRSDDPFISKARAAVWEWDKQLKTKN